MTIARRPVDRDAVIRQALAGDVDVIDRVGDVAEVAAAGVAFRIPVVGELDLRRLIPGRGEKYQCEATRRIVPAREFLQAQRMAKKLESGVEVRYATMSPVIISA